ncbi:MAG: hypothetical protein HOC23_08980 [Halieaceae bacterium]|nr:hypothetical protein [Halieaceae bacterium]
MNPENATPLAGELTIETDLPTTLLLRVSGQQEDSDSWNIKFSGHRTSHSVPILGLKSNSSYTLELVLESEGGQAAEGVEGIAITTAPLPTDFPNIDVLVNKPDFMEPGYTMIGQTGHGWDGGVAQRYGIILDATGEVVWYSPELFSGIVNRLPNGNIVFQSDDEIREVDLLGRVIERSILPDELYNTLHHDLHLTDSETYLSLSWESIEVNDYPASDSDPDIPPLPAVIRDEPVVEIAKDGSVLNTWTFATMLDTNRIAFDSLRESPQGLDWIHSNAVISSPSDDSIIVSLRHQDAVVKFYRSGQIGWILGTHANWKAEYSPYLLTPQGSNFSWQYHQHAVTVTDTNTLLLFDNGNHRASPFDGTTPAPRSESVSRAVEYAINEDTMEVEQVWAYGESENIFSDIWGDADRLPSTGNTLIAFGGTVYENGVSSADSGFGARHARIIEVTPDTPSQKVLDLRLYNTNQELTLGTYRSQRIPALYPDDAVVSY